MMDELVQQGRDEVLNAMQRVPGYDLFVLTGLDAMHLRRGEASPGTTTTSLTLKVSRALDLHRALASVWEEGKP